jgi:hypothetical protein
MVQRASQGPSLASWFDCLHDLCLLLPNSLPLSGLRFKRFGWLFDRMPFSGIRSFVTQYGSNLIVSKADSKIRS